MQPSEVVFVIFVVKQQVDERVFGIDLYGMLELEFSNVHYVLLDALDFVLVEDVVLEVHLEDMLGDNGSDPAKVEEVFDDEQPKEEERDAVEADHVHLLCGLPQPDVENANYAEADCHAVLDDLG